MYLPRTLILLQSHLIFFPKIVLKLANFPETLQNSTESVSASTPSLEKRFVCTDARLVKKALRVKLELCTTKTLFLTGSCSRLSCDQYILYHAICYERAHDLHVWVACPCCWTVPRFPEAACFRKSCGRSLARVCSSLIFSDFRNSAICVRLTARGERLAFLRGM